MILHIKVWIPLLLLILTLVLIRQYPITRDYGRKMREELYARHKAR